MKKIFVSGLLLLMVSTLSGCGGGGSGGVDSQVTVNLSASKAKALANGTDGVTIQADVRNVDGTPVAPRDGIPCRANRIFRILPPGISCGRDHINRRR